MMVLPTVVVRAACWVYYLVAAKERTTAATKVASMGCAKAVRLAEMSVAKLVA